MTRTNTHTSSFSFLSFSSSLSLSICWMVILLVLVSVSEGEITWQSCPTFSSSYILQRVESSYESYSSKRTEEGYVVLDQKTQDLISEYLRRRSPFGLVGDFGDVIPPLNQVETLCAYLKVPADYSDLSDTTKLTYFVKKYSALNGNANCSLMMNQGGPGSSGVAMEILAMNVMTILPYCDIYIPDHRGTGRSSILQCSNEDFKYYSDFTRCFQEAKAQYGSLEYFSTTNAAEDINYFFTQLNSSLPINIYGVSYGTYLVNRYLQLYPSSADVIILDGLCSPGKCRLFPDTERRLEPFTNILNDCDGTEYCASKFDSNSMNFYLNMVDKLNQNGGYCGMTTVAFVEMILPYFDNAFYYPVLMPLIYRYSRCDLSDLGWHEALLQKISLYFEDVPKDTTPFPAYKDSIVLTYLITLSELLFDFTVQDASNILTTSILPIDSTGIFDVIDAVSQFLYDDPLAQKYPSGNVTSRVLIMNGDYDTRTPVNWAQSYAQQAPYAQKDYAEFKGGAHALTVISNNPTKGNHPCATQMMADYISGAILNPSQAHPCLKDLIYPNETVFSESAVRDWFMKLDAQELNPWEGGPLPSLFWISLIIGLVVVAAIVGVILCLVYGK